MKDLSDYLGDKARIVELEKEVARLTRRNVEWKCKYKKLHEKHSKRKILKTRSSKALEQIEQVKNNGFTGTVISQIRLIADKNFLSVGHTQDLWYKSNIKVTTNV